MSWLALLILGCGGGADTQADADPTDPSATSPSTDETTTDETTTDETTTDETTTDETTDDGVEVEIEEVEPHELRVGLSGVSATCAGDEATAAMEFVGTPDEAVVTPWVDGVATTTLELPLSDDDEGAFVLVDVIAEVTDCADAVWVWELRGLDYYACVVTGPGADALLPSLDASCTLW